MNESKEYQEMIRKNAWNVWIACPEIQDAHAGDFEGYLAFLKADGKGQVKILGKKTTN